MNAYSEPLPDDSLGVYVHVPFCQSKCRYCGFYSEPVDDHDPERLVSALIAELDRGEITEPVQTLYVGGGSPTCLPPESLARFLDALASRCPDVREFTVECNPGQTDRRVLSVLRRSGVNRISFGVQSFDSAELALLGRRHTVDTAVRAIGEAQDLGFENIGLDLIFAIPGSTPESWRRSLKSAVALGVQHISAYSLSIEEGTALQRDVLAGKLRVVDEDTDRAMYDLAIDYLASAGFAQYEISNFARQGCACLHNQRYWLNRPYLGIGPSAGSFRAGRRTSNISDIREYIRRVEAGQPVVDESYPVDHEAHACQTAVLNLRMRSGVDLATFRTGTGMDFATAFKVPLERYQRQGLIEVGNGSVRLAREALAIADSVLCDFSSF